MSPVDVIDVSAFGELLTQAGAGAAAVAPIAAPVAAVGAAAAVGYAMDDYLLHNKAWMGFWEGVGGRLNSVWHAAAGFLFGSGALSLDTVGQMIQLSTHIAIRASRQLVGAAATRATAAAVSLHNGLAWLAGVVNGNVASLAHNIGVAVSYSQGLYNSALHYADARVASLAASMPHVIATHIDGLREEVIRDVFTPLRDDVQSLAGKINTVRDEIAHIHVNVPPTLLHDIANIAAVATAAHALAITATDFVDNCGEPMCSYAGPNTDWGKLLKRFAEANIFALLTAVALENPATIEHVAEDLARAIGPVVERWAEGWFGIGGASNTGGLGEIAKGLGSINL